MAAGMDVVVWVAIGAVALLVGVFSLVLAKRRIDAELPLPSGARGETRPASSAEHLPVV